jgi:hypothetical protein
MLILTVIYLGKDLPKYVLENLRYLKTTFNQEEIYFISDSPKSIKKAEKLGVNTWLAPDPSNQWREFRDSLEHPMHFRDGFWFKTLARILVLDSFLQLNPNKSCLQVEADVFLFPNFPISEFQNLDVEIAFPMESKEMGIASLLFLKNHKIASTLANLALTSIKENGKVTDMSLLGKVANSEILEFLPLRTLPHQLHSALSQPESRQLVCKNQLEIAGVFDGITIGQYLLGVDPRNSKGTLILHRIQESHAIDPGKLSLGLNLDNTLILKTPEGNVPIYNLHNHAKDLRLYKTSSRVKLLENRVISSRNGERYEFKFKIFADVASKAVIRRFLIAFKKIKK